MGDSSWKVNLKISLDRKQLRKQTNSKNSKPNGGQDTEHEINKNINTLRKELPEKIADDG